MTDELYRMLLAWLESGTDAQKRHAGHRLSLPDAASYVPGSPPIPPLVLPPIMDLDSWASKIRACEHYNPGCCASPAPFCDLFSINPTRDQCIECLSK